MSIESDMPETTSLALSVVISLIQDVLISASNESESILHLASSVCGVLNFKKPSNYRRLAAMSIGTRSLVDICLAMELIKVGILF